MEFSGYLLLPRLKLEQVNAEGNLHVAGLPAITAFTGFAHWLQLHWLDKLTKAKDLEPMKINGVAIIGHYLQMYEGQAKCPAALQGSAPTSAEKMNPPIVQELKADMGVTLVLRLYRDEEDDQSDVANAIDEDSLKKLNALLGQVPIAAGRSVSHLMPRYLPSSDGLAKALGELNGGWLLCNRKELLDPQGDDDTRDPLDRLLDLLALHKDESGRFFRSQPGWLIPVSIGYRLLETPKQRPGVRHGLIHAYAEPVTSVAQWCYLPSFTFQRDAFDLQKMDSFWRHTRDDQHGLLVVDTCN